MEETMNIVDIKSELDNLTTKLLNEHMKLETMYLQEKKVNTEHMTNINSKNTSICETLQSKVDRIHALEKEINGYKSREEEFNHTIDNLKQQIKILEETNDERNKFDIIRGQAKEISAKDKEIERLTKAIVRLKELNDVKQNISLEVSETKDIVGWSPTSNHNSSPIVEVGPPLTKPDTGIDDDDDDDDDDDEGEDLFVISYRKKKYYRDNDNKVYSIEDNEEAGSCIGNWVKQDNGKFKLVKS
jgi:hypothetical protein